MLCYRQTDVTILRTSLKSFVSQAHYVSHPSSTTRSGRRMISSYDLSSSREIQSQGIVFIACLTTSQTFSSTAAHRASLTTVYVLHAPRINNFTSQKSGYKTSLPTH